MSFTQLLAEYLALFTLLLALCAVLLLALWVRRYHGRQEAVRLACLSAGLALALLAGACSSSPVTYRDSSLGVIVTDESVHTDSTVAVDVDVDLVFRRLVWQLNAASQVDHCWELEGTSTGWVVNGVTLATTGQDPEDVACRELGSRLRAQAAE